VAAQLAASQEGLSSMSVTILKNIGLSFVKSELWENLEKVFITFSYVNVTFSVNLFFFFLLLCKKMSIPNAVEYCYKSTQN
jgi:hypothetical protein